MRRLTSAWVLLRSAVIVASLCEPPDVPLEISRLGGEASKGRRLEQERAVGEH